MKLSTFTKILLLTLLTSVVLPLSVYAAPAISSISGAATHGSAVTITGSNFGTKTTAAPSLWDTVDNKYSLSNGASIPTGGSNPWGAQQGTTYDTSDAQRTSHSTAMYKSTDGHVDSHTVSPTGQLYVSWWLKMSANPIPPDGNHSSKFIRAGNSAHQQDPNVETFSWTQQQSYIYDNNYYADDWLNNGQTDWAITPNQWNFLEVWFDNQNKTYTIKVDGVTKVNASSWAGGNFNFDYVWLIGFDAGGNAPPTLTLWTDDIYIDNTFSRVMIGDASTYASSTHFEMQPPTAWSNSSVTVSLNQGSFADGSTAYLYVIDANGNVSGGSQITFGGTFSTSGTNPKPAPPTLAN